MGLPDDACDVCLELGAELCSSCADQILWRAATCPPNPAHAVIPAQELGDQLRGG